MANEAVQAGTDIILGAQGMAWSGKLITEATWREGYAGSTESKDYNGNVRGKQRAGHFEELELVAEIDDPGDNSETWQFKPGDTVSITFPTDLGGSGAAITGEWQEGVEARLLQGDTMKVLVSGTVRKEDTMTYT